MKNEKEIKEIIGKEVFDYYYSQLNTFCRKQMEQELSYEMKIENGKGCLKNDDIKITFDITIQNETPSPKGDKHIEYSTPKFHFYIENVNIEKKNDLSDIDKFLDEINKNNSLYDKFFVANYCRFQEL